MKVLIVEDDVKINSFLTKGLQESGHVVLSVTDGESGLHYAENEQFDVLIIDRMLPKLDGLALIQTLRGSGYTTPVLVLSALGDVDDKVAGLRAGGDDYLTKPFAFIELLARVEALGKRAQSVGAIQSTRLKIKGLEMDLLGRKVLCNNLPIDLQAREFRLLEYLLKHKGQVVTRTMLLEQVWDYNFDPQTGVIDVHISRLRKKLNDHDASLIKTIRGSGYIIEDRT